MAATPVTANEPGGGREGPPVKVYLTEKNGDVVLANGIVTATINPKSATIQSLRYHGHEMINQVGRQKHIYFSMNGDKGYVGVSDCALFVKTRTPDAVDISCKSVYSPKRSKTYPCDVDIHFVLRRGASGLYVYTVLKHPSYYPDLNLGIWRMVWPMPHSSQRWLMEKIYVDEARHWEVPSPADLAAAERRGIKEICTLTTGPWKGKDDCKYMYNAPCWDLGCWGFASDRNKIGGWLVFGSHEYFNDGPTMSDLTACTGGMLVTFKQVHYNSSALSIPQGEAWQKVYGPILIYCNSSPDGGDACWADAKRQAAAEESAWPYDWLSDESTYPLKDDRGTISGRFVIHDPLKPNLSGANAWVGVAQPPPGGNWQFESANYQYWIHADANGRFTIPNVRPGAYTLYAFTTGAVGEFSQTNVTVQAEQTNVVGEITWNVPHPGAQLAWEIGVPDRTAKEFRHGDDYFKPRMWERFASEFSNPLDYTVGVSDWSKDWNYVQCGYPVSTNWSPWKWRIHFRLTNAPTDGNATLTLAYASSYYGRTEVYVNDEDKMFSLVKPSVDGGNALIREGIHAKYCVEQVPIPMSRLKEGPNTLTLVQGQNRYKRPFFHVMYDYLSLELPP